MVARKRRNISVTIAARGKGKWQLRWTDTTKPQGEGRMYETVSGTKAQAEERKMGIIREFMVATGKVAPPIEDRSADVPTLKAGYEIAAEQTHMNDESRKKYEKIFNSFVEWIQSRYPAVQRWSDLMPFHYGQYLGWLFSEGKAWDTCRNRLRPLRQAWCVMHENFPVEVCPLPKTAKMPKRPKVEIECLDPHEVLAVLDWFKAQRPRTYPIIALMALAGLREQEAAFLRIKDIDHQKHAIHITTSPLHKPKNGTSDRKIPLCAEAWSAIELALQSVTSTNSQDVTVVVPASKRSPWTHEDFQFIFKTKDDEVWNVESISRCLNQQMGTAAAKSGSKRRLRADHPEYTVAVGLDMPRLAEIPVKRLRASFITMIDQSDIKDRLIKAYVGHTSADVMGTNYRKILLDELKAISTKMDGWREVASQESWKKSALVQEVA